MKLLQALQPALEKVA